MSDETDDSYDGRDLDIDGESSTGAETPPLRATSLPLDVGHAEEYEDSETLDLFDSSAVNPSILLAHMLNTSPQPLTRRKFQATSLATSRHTRPTHQTDQGDGDADKQTCIVCYTEPRTIVCWPCRCLAMCDDCRSSMATLPVKQHLCPTCRAP